MMLAAHLVLLFIVVYGYLGLSGSGLYYIIASRLPFCRGWAPVISPILGLAQASMVGSWIFGLGLPGRDIFWVQWALAGLALIYALWTRGDLVRSDLIAARQCTPIYKYGLPAMTLVVGLFLSLPIFYSGLLTPICRIGTDIGQYPLQADFILQNGTLATANTLDLTVNPYADVIWWNTQVVRWGTGFVLADLAEITDLKTYQIDAVVSIVLLMLSGGAMAFFLRTIGFSGLWILWGALALIFNPNLLNVFYEHLEGQAYATPLVIMLFAVTFVQMGSAASKEKSESRWELIFGSVLMAGIIIQHNETFLFVYMFLCACFFLKMVFKEFRWQTLGLPAGSLVVASLLTGPRAWAVFTYYKTFFNKPLGGGWEQPKWALLQDILGLSNIYADYPIWVDADFAVKILSRSFMEGSFGFLITGLMLAGLIYGSMKRSLAERIIYLPAVAAIIVGYIWWGFPEPGKVSKNYLYFKVYTILLPFLIACLIAAVFEIKQSFGVIRREMVALFLALITLFCGGDYLVEYSGTAQHLSQAELSLDDLKRNPKFTRMVYLSCPYGGRTIDLFRYADRLHDYALRTVVAGRIIDQFTDSGASLRALANDPVSLLVYKNTKYSPVFARRSWPILYKNDGLTLYDTGKRVSDIASDKGLRLDVVYGSDLPASIH